MKQRKFALPPHIRKRAEELERLAQLACARTAKAKSRIPSHEFEAISAYDRILALELIDLLGRAEKVVEDVRTSVANSRPPTRAEYVLYLVLGKEEREVVIGDLVQEYGRIMQRFGKRKADIWFYKQVIWSLWPFLRRAVLRLGALIWVGRLLRRLNS